MDIERQASGECSVEGGHEGRKGRPSTRLVMQDIATALRDDRDIAVAVARAAQFFDHHDVERHDQSIGDGAANCLYNALRHIVRQMNDLPAPLGSTNESRTVMVSVACIISSLEMLFRCSEAALEILYRQQLGLEFVATMVNIMIVFIGAEIQSTVIRQLLLKNSTTILRKISAAFASDLMPSVVDVRSLVGVLVRTLQYDAPQSTDIDCATIIARLASQPLNREAMLGVSGLLGCLVSIADANFSDTCTKETIKALMHLSHSENNAVMGESEDVFTLLSSRIIGSGPPVRQYASRAMRNIVIGAENKMHLTTRRNCLLLDATVAGLQAEVDSETQGVCLTILQNLLSDEAMHAIAMRMDLLEAVGGIAIKDAGCKTSAASILNILAGVAVLPPEPDGSSVIINKLVALSSCGGDDLRTKSAEAIFKLSREENRIAMAHQGSGMFQALTTLALRGDNNASSFAIKTIHNLAMEPRNRDVICRDRNISQLLVAVVSGAIVVNHKTYVDSVSAILCLVAHGPNVVRLAKFRLLVPSLADFANSKIVDSTLKHSVINSIVRLSEAIL